MSGIVVIIRPDGQQRDIPFAGKGRPPLATLQRAVGDKLEVYIELIHVSYRGKVRESYVDEEGPRKRLPINPIATSMYGRPLVGNLVMWIPMAKERLGEDL